MNYYPHHIGDFDRATRHLTRIERSVYRDLIEVYYDTERPLTLDQKALCRLIIARSNEESTAVAQVLNEFFTETPTGWYHARCEDEIAHFRANKGQKAEAGRKSAAARALRKQQALNGIPTAVEQPYNGAPTNQEPVTNNQEPVEEETNVSVDKVDRLPSCDRQAVVDLYHEVLPELPRVRVMNDSRGRLITSRWRWVLTSKKPDGTRRAESPEEAMAWLRQFFEFARQNDFIMGRGYRDPKHSNWQADIEYLLSDRGLKQVVEKTGGAS
jgi:uncharacterized protein YdaU (DUF1376 family)